NRSIGSAELRTNVYQRRLFGVKAELELAPFVDAGQVFKDVHTSPINDLHWDYGLGFRGIVRPQIVAFVDVAEGSEGLKVITGVDSPFCPSGPPAACPRAGAGGRAFRAAARSPR